MKIRKGTIALLGILVLQCGIIAHLIGQKVALSQELYQEINMGIEQQAVNLGVLLQAHSQRNYNRFEYAYLRLKQKDHLSDAEWEWVEQEYRQMYPRAVAFLREDLPAGDTIADVYETFDRAWFQQRHDLLVQCKQDTLEQTLQALEGALQAAADQPKDPRA